MEIKVPLFGETEVINSGQQRSENRDEEKGEFEQLLPSENLGTDSRSSTQTEMNCNRSEFPEDSWHSASCPTNDNIQGEDHEELLNDISTHPLDNDNN